MLKTLRECGARVRREGATVHRDRVAHDGGWTADASVGAFGVGMVATSVLGEGGLAAERFAATWHQALVRAPASVDPPVTCERA